jgi:hypothetical protein
MYRHFDGIDDEQRVDIGACAITGSIAIHWIGNPASFAKQRLLVGLHSPAGALGYTLYHDATGIVNLWNGEKERGTPTPWLVEDQMQGIIAEKGTGLVIPRFHHYLFDPETGLPTSWQHANGASAMGDGAAVAGAGATVRFAKYAGSANYFNGDYVAAAIRAATFANDAAVEAYAEMAVLEAMAEGAAGAWLWEQESVEEPLEDITGNGADEVFIVGTTAVPSPPPVPYREEGESPILAADDFEDEAIGTPPWGFNNLCTETGGELRIEVNDAYEGFIEADSTFLLENGFVKIKMDPSGYVGEDGEFFFRLAFEDGLIHFDQAEGDLILENDGDVVRIPYDPVQHAYLRMRFDGVNACWDTSTDGVKWINRRTVAAAVDISKPAELFFQTGRFAAEGAGYFAIDDFEANSEAINDFFSVTTGEATPGAGDATLEGTVIPGGDTFTWWFEFGLTRTYGQKTAPQEVVGGEEAEPLSAEIEDLDPGGHHFRLVVERDEDPGTLIKGNDALFDADGDSFDPTYFVPGSAPWNRKLGSSHTVRVDSAELVANLVAQVALAPPWVNTDKFSAPVYIVEESQPTIKVNLKDKGGDLVLKEAFEAVPLPEDALPAAGTDMHLVVYQPSTDRMWEFWLLRFEEGEWVCTWGGAMENVSTNVGRFDVDSWPGAETYWGATATSLPLLAGLLTLAELEAGEIPHAIALAIPEPADFFIWPAQRSDGGGVASDPPEGLRFRLPPDFDVEGMEEPEIVKVLCRALRDYGMILRDVAGAVVFYGEDPIPSESEAYDDVIFEGFSKSTIMNAIPWSEMQAVSPVHQRVGGEWGPVSRQVRSGGEFVEA